MPEKKPALEENALTGRWLRGTEDEAFAAVRGRREGLTSAEAAARLEEFGPNSVAAPRPSGWVELLRKFKEPLVIQLMVICVLSFLF
jgi:P-type Mg2+ transporter